MRSQEVLDLIVRGELVVKASGRRKKTVTLSKEQGKWVLATPMGYQPEKHLDQIARLMTRLARRAQRTPESDAMLFKRAQELNTQYFSDDLAPSSVRWVANQRARFASCSIESGSIRVSDRLRSVPDWVLDAVLVHELAHLREANHSHRFTALTARFERTAQADIYLAGFRAGEVSALHSTDGQDVEQGH